MITRNRIARKLAVAATSLGLGGGLALAAMPVTPVGATGWTVSLAASSTSPALDTPVTLTATANQDVSYPSPYDIEIYDLGNNGALLNACGSGTTCSAEVNNTLPTCDTYQAYVALYSATAPPPSVQATSATVTVCWGLPWTVSLTAAPSTTLSGTPATLTAVTDKDVGPTPYYIEVYDVNTRGLVAACGGGYTCSTNVTNDSGCHAYVAVIAQYGVAYPPPAIQATSGTESVCWDLAAGVLNP